MKNIVKISIITVLGICLLAVAACSDQFLQDKRDYSRMLPQDVFKDPVQANGAFAVIYKRLIDSYNHPMLGADALMRHGKGSAGSNIWNITDEEPIMANSQYQPVNDKNTKSGNFGANPPYWNDPRENSNYNNPNRNTLFPNIYQINELLSQIELVGRVSYDNKVFWDQLRGQTLFLRAWLYYDAVRFFGGVPYYNTEKDMAQPGDRSDRLSVQYCFDKVCEDFEEAAKLLPAKWEARDDGRFTSVAALAMISRVRIAAASPVFNASWENGTKRWQAALDASLAAEAAARAAGHGTLQGIDAWDKAFYAYNYSTFNPEAIIKIPKSDKPELAGSKYNGWENRIRPGVVRGGGSSSPGLGATEQILAAFPMKDGRVATAANGYDDEKFYRNRDPRFYRTFAFSGCEWPGTTTQIWLYGYRYDAGTTTNGNYRYTLGSLTEMGSGSKTRAIVWKMSDPNVPLMSESVQGTDIIDYRFGELLLNVAECYAALGNIGQSTAYLNQIRNRVGAGSVPTPANKYEAIKAVLNERLVELAYEGKRPWDLRRWLLFEGGAGFDPRMVSAAIVDNLYDPEEAFGLGWKLYNGKNGRPEYTTTNNMLTKLGVTRISGTRWLTNKIWMYDIGNIYHVDPFGKPETNYEPTHPLAANTDLKAVPHITKEMNEGQRDAAFDKLEAFYTNTGMQTMEGQTIPPELMYGINSGLSNTAKNYLFSWRAWYALYPIHYDAYTPGKGNDWLAQNEGWMTANANPLDKNSEQQDGTYIYCTVEE